jgi:XTP/dITP diphosphohydrolase
MKHQEQIAFERLLIIMDELREKCPWDKKQTMESLRHLSIEETYELCDAILEEDWDEVKGELGDLFLHLVFYSKIASENHWFDVTEVLNNVCEKLIRRHPHIYGNESAQTEEEVKANWEQIKLKEKGSKPKTTLSGVPKSLPALVKATRIQSKVRGVGFDWDNSDQVWEKVQEELTELKEAIKHKNQVEIESEFGDVLFSLVNYARFINVNPEDALERSNKKFTRRFEHLEKRTILQNQELKSLSFEELDKLWNEAKAEVG